MRTARHWGPFPDLLAARGVQALTLDLPGVGTERHRPSPVSIGAIVDDLRERFLAQRTAHPWGLYAQSLGGMIALDWAHRYPADFDRVVVTNTSARDLSTIRERLSWFAMKTMVRGLGARDAHHRERLVLHLVSNTERGRSHARTFSGYALEAPIPRAVLFRQLFAAARSRSPARLEVPLVVLASDGDRMVSARCSRVIAERYGAPLHIHPDGGHDLPLDDPEWVIGHLA